MNQENQLLSFLLNPTYHSLTFKVAMRKGFLLIIGVVIILACRQITTTQEFDVIIRNGTLYDGTGTKSFVGDIAIQADTIAAIGNLKGARGKKEIDATGMVVAPGFINMLSWADQNLLKDGRSMSDIKQGVTLEVFGEGWSPGPMKRKSKIPVDSLWTTLDGYFNWLMKKGSTPNVASFIGQTSVRNYVMGYDDRKPTDAELSQMKSLVQQGMEEGAMGLGTSLIYPPAAYASTTELIELAKVTSRYKGI
jgi:N-acyl-D-amino-acid deacylase